MFSIVRSFTARIESHPALAARAELELRVERKLYAAFRSGRKFTSNLAVSFYQPDRPPESDDRIETP